MKTANESKLINNLRNENRFKLLEDGWIQDIFTGLDFGPSSEETMNMQDAIKYCEEKGGRLPELHELHSLVDFSKEKPSIYPTFKDTKTNDWYWSGTKTAWNKSASWCVSFSYGYVSGDGERSAYYVRPVRASQ